MVSLDYNSWFTNVLLEETINISIENLHNDNQNRTNMFKHDFCNLLNIATKQAFFTFSNKFYKQVDNVAMGSPLYSPLTNIFNCCSESRWLPGYHIDFDFMISMFLHYFFLLIMQINWTLSWRRPLSYRNQSIDLRSKSMDWFLYDNGLSHERVKEYLSSEHLNINFSIEKKRMVVCLFLDGNYFFVKNEKIATNLCRKKILSGVCSKFYKLNIKLV